MCCSCSALECCCPPASVDFANWYYPCLDGFTVWFESLLFNTLTLCIVLWFCVGAAPVRPGLFRFRRMFVSILVDGCVLSFSCFVLRSHLVDLVLLFKLRPPIVSFVMLGCLSVVEETVGCLCPCFYWKLLAFSSRLESTDCPFSQREEASER